MNGIAISEKNGKILLNIIARDFGLKQHHRKLRLEVSLEETSRRWYWENGLQPSRMY